MSTTACQLASGFRLGYKWRRTLTTRKCSTLLCRKQKALKMRNVNWRRKRQKITWVWDQCIRLESEPQSGNLYACSLVIDSGGYAVMVSWLNLLWDSQWSYEQTYLGREYKTLWALPRMDTELYKNLHLSLIYNVSTDLRQCCLSIHLFRTYNKLVTFHMLIMSSNQDVSRPEDAIFIRLMRLYRCHESLGIKKVNVCTGISTSLGSIQPLTS